ncbi:MAG: hypothetical protein IPJ76_17235 [Flavobacteriales bacterium]|nr:MAG: hypothetical protein IPJ76_17235 [Flavobacteriales bacterium]
MKTLLLLPAVLLSHGLAAQWCVPTTATPYGTTMPGVTQFTLNTISRASTDIENYPNNSYVNSGLTTTLDKGETYAVTVGFTIDDVIFPGSHMNLRVWVDLNHDGQLDDVGETLLSVNEQSGPTYTGAITVPMNALTGDTRLRVTAKMCSHTGHSLPTPCDLPADPLGYHGELEDYTVEIVDAVGIVEPRVVEGVAIATDGDGPLLITDLSQGGDAWLEVMDASGRSVSSIALGSLPQGRTVRHFGRELGHGTYIGRLWLNGSVHTVRFFR